MARLQSVPVSKCTICSLTPPICPVKSASGQCFCLSCLRESLINNHGQAQSGPTLEPVTTVDDELDVEGMVQTLLELNDTVIINHGQAKSCPASETVTTVDDEDLANELMVQLLLNETVIYNHDQAGDQAIKSGPAFEIVTTVDDEVEFDVVVQMDQLSLNEKREEPIRQLKQEEASLEQLKSTTVCALQEPLSPEDIDWIDVMFLLEEFRIRETTSCD